MTSFSPKTGITLSDIMPKNRYIFPSLYVWVCHNKHSMLAVINKKSLSWSKYLLVSCWCWTTSKNNNLLNLYWHQFLSKNLLSEPTFDITTFLVIHCMHKIGFYIFLVWIYVRQWFYFENLMFLLLYTKIFY